MRLLFALRGDGYLAFTADIKRPFCCRDVTETENEASPSHGSGHENVSSSPRNFIRECNGSNDTSMTNDSAI